MEKASAENIRQHPLNGGSGWSAIAQTVRDVDEAKVKDCKEDIDTLLVFVRLLFSGPISIYSKR